MNASTQLAFERLIMAQEPDLAGFFTIKKLKNEDSE
jgi:hypothetical protein